MSVPNHPSSRGSIQLHKSSTYVVICHHSGDAFRAKGKGLLVEISTKLGSDELKDEIKRSLIKNFT